MIVGGSFGNAAEMRNLGDFIAKRTRMLLTAKCEKKEYTVDGAPDLSKVVEGKKVAVKNRLLLSRCKPGQQVPITWCLALAYHLV